MDTDAAYVAGLIDGEGCLYVEKSRATYRARVSIGMSLPALHMLTEMQARWNGILYQLRPETERWAEAWTWYTWGDSASALLRHIHPYLRLKKRQAEILLEIEAIRDALPKRRNGNANWDDAARAACEELKQEIHRLNRKGPRLAPVPIVEAA